MISLSLLINNNLPAPLLSEHGLAVWCNVLRPDGSRTSLLLDTGQHPQTLAANARSANIDLLSANFTILSHGHYDHSGGLQALAQSPTTIVLSPLATARRFSLSLSLLTGAEGKHVKKENGMPRPDLLKNMNTLYVSTTTEIAPNITVFPLPLPAPANPKLVNDNNTPDAFPDELFTLISDGSLYVLYGGCTHHGLPMLLDHVFNKLNITHIDLFIGGLHLSGKDVSEINAVASIAKNYNVKQWLPLHCTGPDALKIWQQNFPTIPLASTITLP